MVDVTHGSMKDKIFKIKNILIVSILAVAFTVLTKIPSTHKSDDNSKQSGYFLFNVPVTENLVDALGKCKPYHRQYKKAKSSIPVDVLLFPWGDVWNYFTLEINPTEDGYCHLATQKNKEPKIEYNVPVDLINYVGNIMFDYCFSSENDMTQLKQFISYIGEKEIYSTANQSVYIADALHKIENYIIKWDSQNIKSIQNFRKQKLEQEEQECHTRLQTMQDNMSDIIGQKSGSNTDAYFSKCDILIGSKGEILRYQFTIKSDDEIPYEYRIDERHNSKCWSHNH